MKRVLNGHYKDPNGSRDLLNISPKDFEVLIFGLHDQQIAYDMILQSKLTLPEYYDQLINLIGDENPEIEFSFIEQFKEKILKQEITDQDNEEFWKLVADKKQQVENMLAVVDAPYPNEVYDNSQLQADHFIAIVCFPTKENIVQIKETIIETLSNINNPDSLIITHNLPFGTENIYCDIVIATIEEFRPKLLIDHYIFPTGYSEKSFTGLCGEWVDKCYWISSQEDLDNNKTVTAELGDTDVQFIKI